MNDFRDFVWSWLPPASYWARDKIQSGDDAKRFFSEAWDAFKKGEAAAEFGRNWK